MRAAGVGLPHPGARTPGAPSCLRALASRQLLPLERTFSGATASGGSTAQVAADAATIMAAFAGIDYDARPAIMHRSHGLGHAWRVATRLGATSTLARIRTWRSRTRSAAAPANSPGPALPLRTRLRPRDVRSAPPPGAE